MIEADFSSIYEAGGPAVHLVKRLESAAQPGQILVSRSYYEVVSHISEGYTKLFNYEGSRTDKHVREHEVYSVGYTNARSNGIRSPAERAQVATHEGKRQASLDLRDEFVAMWRQLLEKPAAAARGVGSAGQRPGCAP